MAPASCRDVPGCCARHPKLPECKGAAPRVVPPHAAKRNPVLGELAASAATYSAAAWSELAFGLQQNYSQQLYRGADLIDAGDSTWW